MSYSDKKVKHRCFKQSRGRKYLANFRICPTFIHVLIISKFQEYPINTEEFIVMTKSNTDFFGNQGGVTLRLMIGSSQLPNLSIITSMSTLSASFRQSQSKLNKKS